MIFDDKWFEKYQNIILKILSIPFFGKLAKKILCIRRYDIGYENRIIRITPDSYTILIKKHKNGRIKAATDFRTHNKYSKRIYYSFYYVWKLFHFWDVNIANVFFPKLNLGFDTFTVYPDTGSGSTTVDGRVYRTSVDETFSAITTGAGTTVDTTGTTADVAILQVSATSNQYSTLVRGFFTFNTVSLMGATPTAATLSLRGTFKQNQLGGSPDLHIAGANLTAVNNLSTADYLLRQQLSYSSITYSSFSTTGYNDFSLNTSGLERINKNGVSQFSAQLAWDIQNSFGGSWVGGGNAGMQCRFADNTGTTDDPKLVVTFTTTQGINFYLKQGFQ